MAKGEAPASLPASTSTSVDAEAAASAAKAPAAAAAPPPRRSLFARLLRQGRGIIEATPAAPSLRPPSDWKPKKIARANPPARDIVLSVASEGGGGAMAKKNGGSNEHGGGKTVVRICRVGAAVRSLVLPDGTDVVLGSDETLPYLDGSLPYFGVVVGRVANRISNASFTLPDDGTKVLLPANDNGRHCLHGGVVGWDKREWSVVGEGEASSRPRSSVLLSLLSKDGDQGFPGNVEARVLYELLPGGKTLRITFTATTDKPTAVAMTQHSYFNLDGGATGAGGAKKGRSGGGSESGALLLPNILDHRLQIDASRYLPKNAETGVPDGRQASVAGTFLDFRRPGRVIGQGAGTSAGAERPERGSAFAGGRRGFDDCFVIDGFKGPGHVRRAAVLSSTPGASTSKSRRRTLEVWTDARGMQFYSAGSCGIPRPVEGKNVALHGPYAGAALETHAFPNGVNVTEGGEVEAWKKDMVLLPGQEYKHVVEWRFSW